MRTPAAQPMSNGSRYRWANQNDNVSAPQSRHNRQPKSNAPSCSCQKSCPRSSFGRFYAPPSRSRAAQMAWLVEVSKAAKHLCLELPARPEHLRVDTPSGGRKGRESTKSSKTQAWARFSQGICISNISNPRWDCPPYVLYVPMAYQAYMHVKNATP